MAFLRPLRCTYTRIITSGQDESVNLSVSDSPRKLLQSEQMLPRSVCAICYTHTRIRERQVARQEMGAMEGALNVALSGGKGEKRVWK